MRRALKKLQSKTKGQLKNVNVVVSEVKFVKTSHNNDDDCLLLSF